MSIPLKSFLQKYLPWLKKLFLYGLGLFFVGLMVVFLINLWVEKSTKKQVYHDINELPSNDVALVLGTIKLIRNKYRNPYFYNRITAAADLYKKGKVKHFILSGDNHREGYNEPEDMMAALIEKGVPERAITLDFAGFRTLDSVVRCDAIFQQKKVTIISQKFHNHRAAFIANQKGMDVVAYNAKEVYKSPWSKVKLREYLARLAVVLDLYILNRQPRFYGEKIDIKI